MFRTAVEVYKHAKKKDQGHHPAILAEQKGKDSLYDIQDHYRTQFSCGIQWEVPSGPSCPLRKAINSGFGSSCPLTKLAI